MERGMPNNNFRNYRTGSNKPNFRPNPRPNNFLNNPNPNNPNGPKPSGQSKKIWYIAGIMLVAILVVAGVLLFKISGEKDDPSPDAASEYDDEYDDEYDEPLIVKDSCNHIEISIDSDPEYSCFDNGSEKIKLLISRSQENVYFYRLNFVVHSSNGSVNFSSNYGLSSFYTYELDYNNSDIEKIDVYPVVKDNDKEKECPAVSISSIEECQPVEDILIESNNNYVLNDDLEMVLVNDSINDSEDETTSIGSTVFSDRPQKKILGFNISLNDQIFVGKVDNIRHMISVVLPEESSLVSLRPIINISENATIYPLSGLVRNFELPTTYTVTSSDGNTQEYTVYVNKEIVVEDEDYPEEEPLIEEDDSFYIDLFSVANSTATNRQIKFYVSNVNNISNCTLYLNGNVQGWPTNVISNSNNTFNLNALSANNYSVRVGCTDSKNMTNYSNTIFFKVSSSNVPIAVNGVCGSANKHYFVANESFGADSFCSSGNVLSTPSFPSRNSYSNWTCIGSNGGSNVSCSATRFVVSELSGLTAGTWSIDISTAREMARLNKNYYIINYGNLGTCSLCRDAESRVFSKTEFKNWAKKNGIAMIYANDDDNNKEPVKSIRSTYAKGGADFPYIILVGYDGKTLGIFTYRARTINRIRASLNPSSFISVVDSYTSGYR